MTQTVPDISPLMPMHQDPLLVLYCCAAIVRILNKIPCHYLQVCQDWYIILIYILKIYTNTSKQQNRGHLSSTKRIIIMASSNGNIFRVTGHVRGIHRSPVNSPRKDQWRGALMFSLICTWMNDWVNNREAGDFRRHRAHYDVTVMYSDDHVFNCLKGR